MGGLFTPANWGTYVYTKHALEAFAEGMQQELASYGIKVQIINPEAYYTGYNETMADNQFIISTHTKKLNHFQFKSKSANLFKS